MGNYGLLVAISARQLAPNVTVNASEAGRLKVTFCFQLPSMPLPVSAPTKPFHSIIHFSPIFVILKFLL